MRNLTNGKILLALLALASLPAAQAKSAVKPNGLFTDGAVLQRDLRVPVWGTADDGEKVTVSIQNQKVSTVARKGKWMARLSPMKAGGPYTLTIAGKN